MGRQPNKLKQNPRLIQHVMSDGRASLILEYYLGRTETPLYDDDGNPELYTSGAMKGKPKYRVKHLRKKEAVSNIANIFTGSKTKRLESEIADRDRTIENLNLQLSSQQERSSREIGNLRDSMRRQQEQHDSYKRGFDSQMERIEKYFPSVMQLIPAIIDCESVRMGPNTIKALLDCKARVFNSGQKLYDPTKQEYADVSGTEVQIKPDPKDGNQYRLHINGKNIFQWFKDLWQSLRQTISRGIKR